MFADGIKYVYTMDTEEMVKYVLDGNPDKVNNYHLGKTGLIGFFLGSVMKQSNGKADPKEIMDILRRELDSGTDSQKI